LCLYYNKFKKYRFYIGVTSDLIVRIQQHKAKLFPNSFSAKYNCDKLVYYFFYPRIEEAISAEKQIKAGNRLKKLSLINEMNPERRDLYDDLFK
jgi:putative endonuclease